MKCMICNQITTVMKKWRPRLRPLNKDYKVLSLKGGQKSIDYSSIKGIMKIYQNSVRKTPLPELNC